jgi:hypothetical protein
VVPSPTAVPPREDRKGGRAPPGQSATGRGHRTLPPTPLAGGRDLDAPERERGTGAGRRGPMGKEGDRMTSGSRVWVVWMKERNKG